MTPEKAAQALIDALEKWDLATGDNDTARLLAEAKCLIIGVRVTRIKLERKAPRAANKG